MQKPSIWLCLFNISGSLTTNTHARMMCWGLGGRRNHSVVASFKAADSRAGRGRSIAPAVVSHLTPPCQNIYQGSDLQYIKVVMNVSNYCIYMFIMAKGKYKKRTTNFKKGHQPAHSATSSDETAQADFPVPTVERPTEEMLYWAENPPVGPPPAVTLRTPMILRPRRAGPSSVPDSGIGSEDCSYRLLSKTKSGLTMPKLDHTYAKLNAWMMYVWCILYIFVDSFVLDCYLIKSLYCLIMN